MDDECGHNGPALCPGIGFNSPLWFGCQTILALAYVKTVAEMLSSFKFALFLPRQLFGEMPCTILNKCLILPVSGYIGFGLFFSPFIKIPFSNSHM